MSHTHRHMSPMTSSRTDPEQSKPDLRRVLLALNSCHDLSALETAAALAGELKAELHSLFVEDSDLLRTAALPFSHEITLSSAARLPLQTQAVERELRTQAERLRRWLSERSPVHPPLHWRLDIVRGRLVNEALSAAGTLDTFVLGPPRCPYGHTTPHRPGPVLTLYSGDPGSERALAVAASLSDNRATELVVLLPARDRGQWEQRRAAASRELAALGVTGRQVRYRSLQAIEIKPLVDNVRAERAALLVVDGVKELNDARFLHSLWEQTVTTLVVVR